MEVRGLLEIAGLEKLASDPLTNLFTSRTYWNTTSNVLRLYANGIWNTVGAIADVTGTVKFDAVLDADLDLSGVTADVINYGYLLYPTTTPNDVARTVTTPTVASGEFDQVSLKLFSYYFSEITAQTPDGKLFRLPDGTTSATITIKAQEYAQIFYDPDIGSGEWIVTETSEDDVSHLNNIAYISASRDLTDYYITNALTNEVSRFDIPVTIINESGSDGSEITLFDGTSDDLFIAGKQIAVFNPTAYTLDVTAFTAQTIKNNFTGVSQATWTLAAGKYVILTRNATQYEISDSSDSAITQLSTGGGLSLVVLTGPLTQALEWGKHYLLDSTGGSSTLTLPATAGLTSVQEEQAKLRIHDISLDWDTNPCTIIPPSGSQIRDGAIDESWVLDSQDTWYLFSRVSDTAIAMEHPFTPQVETVGGSGSGTGSKNYVLSPDSIDNVTDVGGSVAELTAIVANLPEETKGSGILVTQTAGSIGDTSTWETDAIDDGDGGTIGSCEMYFKTVSGYVDDAASIQWYNSDTATVLRSFDIKAGTGRISNYQDSTVVLTTDENIKPRIYWNVTSETNGLVVSGAGTLAETALVGGAGGWKQYDIGPSGIDKVTVTNVSSPVVVRAVATPYKDPISGAWRMVGNIRLTHSADDAYTITIDGITYESTANNQQAVTVKPNVSTTTGQARCDPGSNTINTAFSTATSNTAVSYSFDVELDSKPTWADFDGSVMLGTEAQAQNARLVVTSNNGQVVGASSTIIYEDVAKDTHSAYDNTTGEYTVPASGDYAVTASATSTGDMRITVVLDGTVVARSNLAGAAETAPVSTILEDLTAGSVIRIDTNVTPRTLDTGAGDNRFTISRIGDRSSKATGFPTSNNATADAEYLVPRYQTETVNATGSGSFTSGNVTCTRIGNFVQITSDTGLGHASLSTVNSADGLIPADFRPLTTSQYNTPYHDATSAVGVEVNTAGRLQFFFRDDSGSVSRTSTGIPVNISYLIV